MPSHAAQAYLHDEALGRRLLPQHDADNRTLVADYLHNVESMERLVRLNANRTLLRKNLALSKAAGSDTLDAEVCGLRVGDFHLVTFPGELSAQVGLAIKRSAGQPTSFVAGYTNGYIYYTPTPEQRRNTGFAQEDCDTLVAPEWQAIFEAKAVAVLQGLGCVAQTSFVRWRGPGLPMPSRRPFAQALLAFAHCSRSCASQSLLRLLPQPARGHGQPLPGGNAPGDREKIVHEPMETCRPYWKSLPGCDTLNT